MSTVTQVVITDDIDGSAQAESISFAFDGTSYEIDLGERNFARFEKAIAPYIEAGRRVAPARGVKHVPAAPKRDLSDVRAWARQNGLEVSERGRISAQITQQYEAAHN